MASLDKMVRTYGTAISLMEQHGLIADGWKFQLSKTKRAVGDCHYATKTIRVSEHFISLSPWEQIEDTILHEIAHALVGWKHGHDYVWKAMARKIGANPSRVTETAVTTARYNYVMRCPVCKREWKRYRMKRRNFGSKCPTCQVEVKIYKYNYNS